MKRKVLKFTAVFLAVNLLVETFFPAVAWALTGGPSQPEVNSFEPVGTSEMVDLSSGDFVYNIPLLDVGGYPVNISYHSGVSMDQEASWVGLGWNINAGTINRNMRGLPDDFNGNTVTKEFNMRPNETFGASFSAGFELAGNSGLSLSFGFGINYNNYVGFGYEEMLNVGLSSGDPDKSSMTLGLGLKSSSDGLDINPSLSYSSTSESTDKHNVTTTSKTNASVGLSMNSRSGMKGLTLGLSTSEKTSWRDVAGNSHSASSKNEGSSSISFANPTYIPQISMPMQNSSITVSVKFGGTFFTATGTGDIAGYYSRQALSMKSQSLPAFGYLYSHNGQAYSKVLLDFNREKDGAITKHTPNLPVTNLSYDLYTVSGQGVGGMFRPFRSDLGYVFDPLTSNNSDGGSLGIELSVGNAAHSGADIMINNVTSTTGKWSNLNYAAPALKFRGSNGSADYEPFYFKEAGEKSVDSDPALFNTIGGSSPTKIRLNSSSWGYDIPALAELKDEPSGTTHALSTSNTSRAARQKRNQLFSFLTAEEYSEGAFQKDLATSIYSNGNSACDKHIAEITTYKTDGTRYVYGIPAYNIVQKEVSFNISDNGSNCNCSTGLKQYSGTDNTPSHENGVDHYFSSTTLPAYAHSYLLTAVLSADYVDITGNGPSDDDYGTYTKFKYSKTTGSANDGYHWRVPYDGSQANYNEGLRTRTNDDQGSYVYGRKELWYLDSIVTKNYIAVFETDFRSDAVGVAGENGGIASVNYDKMKLLKKISLYSRPDYIASPTNAVPIKQVHFIYDYTLCTNPTTGANGVPNNVTGSLSGDWYVSATNRNGKLTLKKLFFTYGKSFKAKLSPYEFFYRTNSALSGNLPFLYNLKAYDRWGNYKPNPTTCNNFTNAEFPYVEQDKAKANDYTAAWSLNQIKLPSGGIINVEYESDDYAYVQNKRAMQMFRITGISNSYTTSSVNTIDNLDENSHLYFDLQEPIPSGNPTTALDIFKKNYLDGVDNIYFRFLINVNGANVTMNNNNMSNGQEYVSGYANLDDSEQQSSTTYSACGLTDIVNNHYTRGYIRLAEQTVNDNGGGGCNPIAKAAWQFARMHTPREAYDYDDDPTDFDVIEMVKQLVGVSLITSIIDAFQGPNAVLQGEDYGKYVYPKVSASSISGPVSASAWIRLQNPNMKKLGGGCRVKKLTVSDEWGSMLTPTNNDQTFSYGQEYTYTTIDPATKDSISSGVATYEPLVGADENSWKQPVFFSEKNLLAPDNDMFMEEPFGETFFPSPSITYSRVTVKNLQNIDVKRNATGYVVHEFYTSKDFPVIPKRTSMKPVRRKTDLVMNLLKLDVKDYMTASQGYSIELNDMNAKPKAQWVYAEDQEKPISGVEYKYKSNGNRLVNDATTIDKNGNITTTSTIGIDYDFVADFRQSKTKTISAGTQPNLVSFLVGLIPIVIPPIWPSISKETTQFRSAVVTKVIFRYGLLEETIAYDLGSKVSTKNLAYDAQTGDVLLTRTVNEFDDGIYSLNYPGHWAYDGLGPAYKNIGVALSITTNAQGEISPSNPSLLSPGDEVLLINGGTYVSYNTNDYRFWIHKKNGALHILKRDGQPLVSQPSSVLKVIRSGRRNQQATNVESMTSMSNPLTSTFTSFNEGLGIINANAVIYTESWNTFCPCDITASTVFNPYIKGMLGIWRKKKDFLYLTERVITRANDNTNARKDGIYQTYKPFWTPPSSSGEWQMPSDLNTADPSWTWTSLVSIYSPYGFELENKDALGRYSAAIYSYKNTLPTAVSSNSKYQEIGFDSFEDYDVYDCALDHFSFKENYLSSVISTESHSGKKSLKVTYNNAAVIEKPVSPANCPDPQ